MICPVCSQVIPDGSATCPVCGAALTAQQPVAQQPVAQQPVMQQPAQMPANVKQFVKAMSQFPEIKKIGSEINVCAIVSYIVAGLSLVLGLVVGNYGIILDVLIVAGMGLWLQLGYSRAAAIILLVYAALNCIITTISTGSFSGYLILILGIFSVIYTFKGASEFKKFKQNPAGYTPGK